MTTIDPLFEKIVAIPSVSGYEKNLQELVAKVSGDNDFVIEQDALNNCIAKKGTGEKKVLITAHADEVGFIVTHIDESGFISFQPVGGVDEDIAAGQPIVIHTSRGAISGIIGRVNDWNKSDADNNVTPYKDLWIDIGDTAQASQIVSIGDPISFDAQFHSLENDFMLSRAADNKLGIFLMLKLLERFKTKELTNILLFAASSTREEVGSRGIQTIGHNILPHYAIVIDTINATDVPNSDITELGSIKLGEGPVLSRGSNTDEKLFALCKDIAEKENIPYQVEAEAGAVPSDLDPLQINGDGSATININVPIRYSHFPMSIFSWQDVNHTIHLLKLLLENI